MGLVDAVFVDGAVVVDAFDGMQRQPQQVLARLAAVHVTLRLGAAEAEAIHVQLARFSRLWTEETHVLGKETTFT